MEKNEYWEFSLKVEISKSMYLLYIKDCLSSAIKHSKGIITMVYSSQDLTLLIGLPLAQKNTIKPLLYSYIASFVVNIFKREYICSKFNFCVKQDIIYKSFIQSLVSFDEEIDKRIVFQKLLPYDKIVLDSFFNFRLKVLKQKWNDLISLANDNYLYLLSGGNFLELMKFMLSNIESKVSCVEVKFDNNGKFNLFSLGKKLELPIFIKNNNAEDVVVSLVSLSPKKIVINDSKFLTQEIRNFLYDIFENKVEITK